MGKWTHTSIGRFTPCVFGGIWVNELFDFPGLHGYYVQDDFGNLIPCEPNHVSIST